MQLAELLLTDKSIQELQASLKEYEDSLAATDQLRNTLLNELRKSELEARKIANQEEEQLRKVMLKKNELLDIQSNSVNK